MALLYRGERCWNPFSSLSFRITVGLRLLSYSNNVYIYIYTRHSSYKIRMKKKKKSLTHPRRAVRRFRISFPPFFSHKKSQPSHIFFFLLRVCVVIVPARKKKILSPGVLPPGRPVLLICLHQSARPVRHGEGKSRNNHLIRIHRPFFYFLSTGPRRQPL
jgi:hypothetical protein